MKKEKTRKLELEPPRIESDLLAKNDLKKTAFLGKKTKKKMKKSL